jgi:hypothetical protein
LAQVRNSGFSADSWFPGNGTRQATFIDLTLCAVTLTPGSKRAPALSPLYSRQLPVSAAVAAMHAAALAVNSAIVLIDMIAPELVVGRHSVPLPCLRIRQFLGCRSCAVA